MALTTIAHSGRNDATHDLASLDPLGKNHGEENPVGAPEGDPSNLAVILACVDALRVGPAKTAAANAKSNPRSVRFRSLFTRSQVKRTHIIYVCIYKTQDRVGA